MKYLIFIDMRTLDEAKSVYPHLVFKFIDIDLTSDKRYIYRMCEMLANKEANEREIKSVFSNRCEINELLSSDDVDGRSLMQLIKDNAKGNFRRRWYWYKEAKDDWKRTIIYEDENTTINKPSTFIESRNVGSSIWCFCNNEYKWEQHNFGDEPETIYFVHSLSVKKELEYCAVCVRTNGDKLIIDGLHNYLSRQNGAHSGYLSSIGSKAEAKLVSDKTPSLPSTTTQSTQNNKTDKNESKNMNRKNTIRLTESELKRVITESVKNILKEQQDGNVTDNPIINQLWNELMSINQGLIKDILQKYGWGKSKELGNGVFKQIVKVSEAINTFDAVLRNRTADSDYWAMSAHEQD